MFRVLMNLVRNAAQALESTDLEPGWRKQITVNSWREDKAVVIEVADTGLGVPEVQRERLFTPFGSGRSGGSGLGLVIAADLVRGHGGAIKLVTGRGDENSGAVFQITLPETGDGVE
jgi:signal transduction histidine kinase